MPEKKDASTLINECSNYISLQIVNYTKATERGLIPPFLVDTAQRAFEYSGLTNPENFDSRRFVLQGNFASILPENFSIEEQLLAEELTSEVNESSRILQSKLPLRGYKSQPITTIFLRTSEEVEKVTCPNRPEVSGVISRTRPLLFNFFNIEAALFAIKVYGEDIGSKIVSFSYGHDGAHQIFAQNLAAILDGMGVDTAQITSSWYKVIKENEVLWELWANQLPNQNENLFINGEPVFPNWVSKQGENLQFSGKTIYEAKTFGVLADKYRLHYPKPNGVRIYPFVMDPADAQEYQAVEKYIQGIQDPLFPWLLEKS